MKPNLIVNSLPDQPAQAVPFAAFGPGRARNLPQSGLAPSLRAGHQDPLKSGPEFYSRAGAWFQNEQPWPRGGLNE